MQELASLYPDAVKIWLVQDNLNTHTPNAFYECLSAQEAATLAARFDRAACAVLLHAQVWFVVKHDRA